eukprot:2660295-Rhodomonas_salina.2
MCIRDSTHTHIQRERERERERDRQTDTDRHTDTQTHRQTHTWAPTAQRHSAARWRCTGLPHARWRLIAPCPISVPDIA